MNLSKDKNIIIILEGFGVFIVAHAIEDYYFAPSLKKTLSGIPPVTISMLSSYAISPVTTIIYLAYRSKYFPKFFIKREMFPYVIGGIVMAWVVAFISLLFTEKGNPFAQEILETPAPYLYLNLFLLILWSPFLEETLNRSYFFELLRQRWGDSIALILSSILFVIPHGIWGFFDVMYFFILFLYSIVFTLTYIHGGLIASISVHAFVNFYFLYINGR